MRWISSCWSQLFMIGRSSNCHIKASCVTHLARREGVKLQFPLSPADCFKLMFAFKRWKNVTGSFFQRSDFPGLNPTAPIQQDIRVTDGHQNKAELKSAPVLREASSGILGNVGKDQQMFELLLR